MRHYFTQSAVSENKMDCFGTFDITQTLCKNHRTLRLNCIVERDYSIRMEIIDEMNALHLHTRKTQ